MAPTHTDPTDAVVDTLLLPFEEGAVAWPDDGVVRMLNARAAASLKARASTLVCQQPLRPLHDALAAAGFRCDPPGASPTPGHPVVLLPMPRQRDHGRVLLAQALAWLQPGGTLVAAAANNQGARTMQSDMEALLGPVRSISKHRCRAVWGVPEPGAGQSALARSWLEAGAERPILDGRFRSRPGLFAWDRIDAGSALLAEHIDPAWNGQLADLGAGWGFLSDAVLRTCPGITSLDAFEADARALPLLGHNLASHAEGVALELHWHDVTRGLPGRYDVIVTNPPFHEGRADAPDLGRGFIDAAADALRPGGTLQLVANRHLPYEARLHERFASVRLLAQDAGFKLYRATGPRRRA